MDSFRHIYDVHVLRIVPTLCCFINTANHSATINNLARQECFSDSESDGESDSDESSAYNIVLAKPRVHGRRTTLSGSIDCVPLHSTFLIGHVVDAINAMVCMKNDKIDSYLAKHDTVASLLDLFRKHPEANILHCKLTKTIINILDRKSGRVNSVLVRSAFKKDKHSNILSFIRSTLRNKDKKQSQKHSYRAHVTSIGVKIHQISR